MFNRVCFVLSPMYLSLRMFLVVVSSGVCRWSRSFVVLAIARTLVDHLMIIFECATAGPARAPCALNRDNRNEPLLLYAGVRALIPTGRTRGHSMEFMYYTTSSWYAHTLFDGHLIEYFSKRVLFLHSHRQRFAPQCRHVQLGWLVDAVRTRRLVSTNAYPVTLVI